MNGRTRPRFQRRPDALPRSYVRPGDARGAPLCVAFALTAGAAACGGASEPATRDATSGSEGHGGTHEHGHHHGGDAHHGGGCHERGGSAGDGSEGDAASPGTHHDDFTDVECFARLFDAPEREAWQRPDEVIVLLELAPGMTVADLGAGTGYFEARLDRAVGETGHVLALDVEPAMVEHMRARFESELLVRTEARVVAADDPALAPASVDRVLIVDTWHHIDAREAYAAHLGAALRPGGAILVVDFTTESPEGPPPEMRLSAETCAVELASAGLVTEIVAEDLPYQWVVRARRAPE